jgi:hypothetical protein
MGLFFKKTKPDEELVEKGLRGTATVLHVEMAGMVESISMSNDKAEEMIRGDVTPIRRKVRMRVEVPGREAYEVETKLNVPVLVSGKLVAGSGVSVLVDPDDPKHVAVDWSAGVQTGSPGAMLQDNPWSSAVLQGMGLDPQQLAQQMEQAQAMAQAYMAQQGMQPGTWPGVPGAWPGVPGVPGTPPQTPPTSTPQEAEAAPPGSTTEDGAADPAAGWPQPQAWPDQSPPAEGPTSDEKPED